MCTLGVYFFNQIFLAVYPAACQPLEALHECQQTKVAGGKGAGGSKGSNKNPSKSKVKDTIGKYDNLQLGNKG